MPQKGTFGAICMMYQFIKCYGTKFFLLNINLWRIIRLSMRPATGLCPHISLERILVYTVLVQREFTIAAQRNCRKLALTVYTCLSQKTKTNTKIQKILPWSSFNLLVKPLLHRSSPCHLICTPLSFHNHIGSKITILNCAATSRTSHILKLEFQSLVTHIIHNCQNAKANPKQPIFW